jgi:hypothetical protein
LNYAAINRIKLNKKVESNTTKNDIQISKNYKVSENNSPEDAHILFLSYLKDKY